MKTSILLMTLFLIVSSQLSAQWFHTNGPRGCTVYDMMIRDTVIFMCPIKGVYQFDNDFNTWIALNQDIHCSKIVAKGNKLFGCCGGTVCLSTDNGITWEEVNNGIPTTSGPVLSITHVNDILYASVAGNMILFRPLGFYRSSDDGANWTCVLPGVTFNSIICDINSEGDTILFAGSGNSDLIFDKPGIYKSTNNGISWSLSGNFNLYISELSIILDKSGNSIILAGTDSGFLRSTDHGLNWSSITNGLKELQVTAISVNFGDSENLKIYAATEGGNLYSSNDYGIHWNKVDSWSYKTSIGSIKLLKNIIYMGTNSGIFRSTNNGISWEYLGNGLPYHLVTALVVYTDSDGNESLLAGTYSGGIFRSTDQGDTWCAIDNAYGSVDVHALIVSGYYIYAAGSAGVFYSTNNGDNWHQHDSGLKSPVYSLAANDSVVFAGGDKGSVYRSIDYGASWSQVHIDSTWNNHTNGLAISGKYVYAGREYGLCRSTDSGTNWSDVNSNDIISVSCMDSKVFAGKVNGGIIVSDDNGVSWTDVNVGTGNRVMAFMHTGSDLFAGGSGGVFKLTENMVIWDSISTGTPYSVDALAATQSYLFAGVNTQNLIQTSTAGVWRRSLAEIVSVKNPNNNIPDQISLKQNYPNPFNPTTTIKYSIPKASFVTLKVFDILGREVSVLVNEYNAGNDYEIKFDASNFASGIYLYQLKVGDYIATKKLLLIK